MSETRRQYDPGFKAGAVRIVLETRRSVAEVARELGIGAGTLGNWVRKDRAELEMERDVLKRSVVLWVKEATR
jgi:transposase